jgi:hypothetical protein
MVSSRLMARRRWTFAFRVFLVSSILLPGFLAGAGAQDNDQQTFPLRSREYEALRTLHIEQGVPLPFSSGPFPAAELRASLDRIDYGDLSGRGGKRSTGCSNGCNPFMTTPRRMGAFATP